MPTRGQELAVAIVEDDRRYREGIVMLLDGTPGFRLAGAFGSIEEALVRGAQAPEVILVDVQLPGARGSAGVQALKRRWPEAQALMLTALEDEDVLFESLCHGAIGYLLKRTPPARLLEAIVEARGGGSPMSPEIARKLVGFYQRTPPPASLDAELTLQERRLLGLLAEGESYQTAADAMRVSINTIRGYIRAIYEKLQVHTKAEAVTKALRAGLV
ncbi:MAG: response regulator transcription factor [Thermoanaerobaculia bacterium]|nr:response regulator transcription factor [Thermoanaerobaculia bacterium]